MGCLFFLLSLSLPPQILPISTSWRTVNKTSWSNQRHTQICYIFPLWVIVKALLKQISLYLPSHSRIRIIVLTCDNNVMLQVCKKSSAKIKHACKITQITMMRGQYYFKWNLCSLSVCSCSWEDSRVPPLNLYWDTSTAEDLSCLKQSIETLFEIEGTSTQTHSSLCSWASVSEQIANNARSSDLVFRKYKQDSAFCASGVLQLAKTGPLVTKNFPLLRLPVFLSDALIAWRFYTPYYTLYDVNCTNLHILIARRM